MDLGWPEGESIGPSGGSDAIDPTKEQVLPSEQKVPIQVYGHTVLVASKGIIILTHQHEN